MKNYNIFICTLIIGLLPNSLNAQSLCELYTLIDQNNVALRTYEAKCQASKAEARLGLTIANPEIEFGYLWGTPCNIGTRKDISVKQSLDFATLFGPRRHEANSRSELADLEMQQARNMLYFRAEQLVIDLTYINQRIEQLTERLATARQLVTMYEKLLQMGETDKIELSRIKLASATVQVELDEVQAERTYILQQLQSLCGSSFTSYKSTLYPTDYLHGDLSQSLSRQRMAVAEQREITTKAERWPELSAGYMAELTRDEKWHGITVGLSVPLWSNKRKMTEAHAQQRVAEAEYAEETHRLNNMRRELQSQITATENLHNTLLVSHTSLLITPLLQKALQAGEISLPEYLLDRSQYYDLQDRLLETRHTLESKKAELAFITAD